MPQTLVEKIAQRAAIGWPDDRPVQAGDYLSIRPAHLLTHDNTAAVIPKFTKMGATRVHDPGQPVFVLDHDIQNQSPDNLAKYATIRQFASTQHVDFYPAGRGIGHQVMVEQGYVLPGTLVVASDSHANLYGALAALGTPVVRTDAAAIWATGRTWWQVPSVVRVELTGRLQPGVVGKDVIISLCGVFNRDEVLNTCIEFTGPGVAHLSIEERMTISNMTTEWGALAGVFPYDAVTREYLLTRIKHLARAENGDAAPRRHLTAEVVRALDTDPPRADEGAAYAKELTLDLAAVTPFVSGPNTVKDITALPDIEQQQVRIDKAYLMSCVNGRAQDFAAAAEVVRGRRIAPHVAFYIAAASSEVEAAARDQGHWQALVDAGARALPAGCGACIGLGEGTLEAGEVGISATNRNFQGRMGSRDAKVYLASPAVVAASAVAGRIAAPGAPCERSTPTHAAKKVDGPMANLRRHVACRVGANPATGAAQGLLPGFPEQVDGELLFVPRDNLNTDGIYGKDYTYREGMAPEQMAAVAMENYDPRFQELARTGDLLVGGYNFGSGSSREQAATALKYRGLALIIAGSFSQTYKRNAFNNGYICIECPQLVEDLRGAYGDAELLTIRSGWHAAVRFVDASIRVTDEGGSVRTYAFAPLGTVAQELIISGGFEAVIAGQLAAVASVPGALVIARRSCNTIGACHELRDTC